MLFLVGAFFTLGWIDKVRLEKASVSHKPELIYSHEKIIVKDGGSVIWESFIYEASESRRMEVIKINSEHIIEGFQGVNWKWKFHNLLLILLIVTASLVYKLIRNRQP